MPTVRTRLARSVASHTLSRGMTKNYARSVAAYLLSERRTGELDSLLRDIQADWARQGYVEAVVSSAHPLSDSVRADIKSQLQKLYPQSKKIAITDRQDPAIIGGVRVNLPDRQLDFSVETKLNKLRGLLV